MREGDVVEITKVCKARECFKCGEPAIWKHTFLYEGSRSNPRSKAYRKDDCSWCEDDCNYACEEHKDLLRNTPPDTGLRWCSSFPKDKFEHLFLYWEMVSAEKIFGGIKG